MSSEQNNVLLDENLLESELFSFILEIIRYFGIKFYLILCKNSVISQ